MTDYCSVRIQKVKVSGLKGMTNHNQRVYKEHGSHIDDDKSKLNETLHGDNSPLWEQVNKRLAAAGVAINTGSHNGSVVAVEIVISATPSYFRPYTKVWGEYDVKKVDVWKEKVLQTLKEKYGDDFVHATLHLDEATPHIHAVVTPIVTKDCAKRRTKAQIAKDKEEGTNSALHYTKAVLDAKHLFDKAGLIQLQTDIAAPLKELGISRGIKGSSKKHIPTKRYWDYLAPVPLEPVRPPKIKLQPKPFFESQADYTKREEDRIQKEISAPMKKLEKKVEQVTTQADFWSAEYTRERGRTAVIAKILDKGTIQEHLEEIKAKDKEHLEEIKAKDKAIEDLKATVSELQVQVFQKSKSLGWAYEKTAELEKSVQTLTEDNRRLELKLERATRTRGRGIDS